MLPRSTLNNIPEGFTIGVAPDGQQYLVPQYLVPALDQAFATYHSKMRLDVVQANPGSSQTANKPYVLMGEGRIFFPPDPQLSDQENLNIHAEVLALQEKLGISYKDASHRLYMAELERLKVADETHKAFKNLDKRISQFLHNLNERLSPENGNPNSGGKTNAFDL